MRKAIALGAIAMIGIFHAAAQVKYTVTDLGTLPRFGTESWATSINDHGDVIGESVFTSPVPGSAQGRPFLWHNGVIIDMSPSADAKPLAINNQGKAVLYGYTYGNSAIIYQNGSISSFPSHTNAEFNALNNLGTVLGQDTIGGFLFVSQGNYQRIAFGTPTLISDRNQLAGAWNDHAAFWRNSSAYPTDLGAIGSNPAMTHSLATGINNHGVVVGWSFVRPGDGSKFQYATLPDHVVQFSDGVAHDLGTLLGYDASEATGINDDGVIVGNCRTIVAGTPGTLTSFVYRSGKMTDLNSSMTVKGWTIQTVAGINSAGQIAATAINAQYPIGHALRLNPVTEKKKAKPALSH